MDEDDPTSITVDGESPPVDNQSPAPVFQHTPEYMATTDHVLDPNLIQPWHQDPSTALRPENGSRVPMMAISQTQATPGNSHPWAPDDRQTMHEDLQVRSRDLYGASTQDYIHHDEQNLANLAMSMQDEVVKASQELAAYEAERIEPADQEIAEAWAEERRLVEMLEQATQNRVLMEQRRAALEPERESLVQKTYLNLERFPEGDISDMIGP